MSNDFDWHGKKDRDSIILTYQPPTAVYQTVGGNVVVRQKADETEEYDPQIFLTPQGALAVAWALIEEAHLVGLPEASGSLMVESPHWPPVSQRPKQPADGGDTTPSEPGPLLRVMEGGPDGAP